ncbi:MAG: hypothetical protein HN657_00455 [Candidatus Marinimicrobia bacterium]|jgi:Ca2+-dependent lipid-binding protein|nr:hypothetical protein [Candidatus Neomarinimicrobiota bacterium]MBT3496530.1 hypothetical protein [Candidatus Neomarinimicrobiota bacterium]MBT3691749.1 hypothetical protein [Candidatus Neomarinimicrobiota bacterium]MBT3732684.1 hypothetical protein [Candidatus Neomarinimicrobiota bacterium]MBT4144269.1 hypothetical protein [Candidatus Neomarinimicrobiota bacterium]
MQTKQIAWYLIFGGLAIVAIQFIGAIFSFIAGHPILGLALVAISLGVGLLLYDMSQKDA